MSINKLKTLARKKAKARRYASHLDIGPEASQQISNFIEEFLLDREGCEIVAAYMPIQTEIDITPVISKLRKQGKILCLPVIVSETKPLHFRIWNENSILIEDEFRVLTPLAGEVTEPDLILCPLLSFDGRGYRLGYGGGFYDRTIEHLLKTKSIFTLGCAYSDQEAVEPLPVEKYDRQLDAVVTENGFTFF